MLCATLKEVSYLALMDANEQADLVEFRLDLFPDLRGLASLRKLCRIPVIFTCHKVTDELLALKPDYIDLPHTASAHQFASIPSSIERICSFHDFEKTPGDLNAIYHEMQKLPAHYYKIATYAHSIIDTLRLLAFVKKTQVIGVAMGVEGQLSRIIAPIMGSAWTYAPLCSSQRTAEGQLSLQELKGIYHFHQLSTKSSLFGLIGDPVTTSVSHRTHNQVFEKFGIDAVYVKMRVGIEQLKAALPLIKEIGFRGLSVTMPHKEAIIPYLDRIETSIDAINTVLINDTLVGTNTDGMGAIDAIERKISIKGKKIAIMGAGGSAKAIAYEAKRRGAFVTQYNRTLYPDVLSLSALQTASYDVLINTIPTAPPITPIAGCVVMDIVVCDQKRPLLVAAEKRGCVIIEGIEMFIHQAIGQFMWWFHET